MILKILKWAKTVIQTQNAPNKKCINNKQLLDEAEQNIVISQWRGDQLLADAEGRGKYLICETLTNHDIL